MPEGHGLRHLLAEQGAIMRGLSLHKGAREVVISDMLAALRELVELVSPHDGTAIMARDVIAAAEAVGIRAALADGDA